MFWNGNKDKELIEYAEQEAKILAAFQIECADSLERASNTFMNMLLGGAGGALALAISLHEEGAREWFSIGVFSTSIYLFFLAALVLWKCLKARDLYPSANDPAHLYSDATKNLCLNQVKYYELENRQKSIERNRNRNFCVGSWLNIIRAMSTLTPIIIVICYSVFS